MILIDKENSIFPNQELTQKGQNYTITFLPSDAEKFHNQGGVYYFSKYNSKFALKTHNPEPGNKKEEKVSYIGMSYSEGGKGKNAVFDNFSRFLDVPEANPEIKVFHISKNHPRIK